MKSREMVRSMRRFSAGEPEAVRDLYERYGRAVFTVAFRSLGDRGLAEEAVQQTFLQAWRGASRFDPNRDPAPVVRHRETGERRHVSQRATPPGH